MGLRFRKSYKLGPLRFTASKSGISSSIGVKGLRLTKTARGAVRGTVSVPGTGISYSTEEKRSRRKTDMKTQSATRSKKPLFKRWWFWLIVVLLIGSAFGGNSHSGDAEPDPLVTAEASVSDDSLPVAASSVDMAMEEEPVSRALSEDPAAVSSAIPEVSETLTLAEDLTEPEETAAPVYSYVLNTNTMKFHSSYCSSAADIKENNRQEFTGTRDEVIAMGYEPCARCHP